MMGSSAVPGMNLTGSRLLMLSKNAEVCFAGVAGILTSELLSEVLLIDYVGSS